MKKITISTICAVLLPMTLLSTPALARQAAMDRCSRSVIQSLRPNDYAFVLSRVSNDVEVTAIRAENDRARRTGAARAQRLGRMNVSKINRLNPQARRNGAYAMTAGYVVVGAVAGLEMLMAAGIEQIAGATALFVGGSAINAGIVGVQYIDAMNPVAQYERGNVETCLQRQLRALHVNSDAVVIRMNNRDDFEDTLTALMDLIGDLAK